jgi:2-keto-myo-inositol isomerase
MRPVVLKMGVSLEGTDNDGLVQIEARMYDVPHSRGSIMIEPGRFALNRITCPSLGLEDFFRFSADLGLTKVELRNDIAGQDVIDGLSPSKAAALAEHHGVRIITINALQKFNLKAVRARSMEELEKLLDLAAAIHCPAIVLCPNNDTGDARDAVTRVAETVEALRAFGPSFMKRGMQGYVEPLGFPESSLSSILVAMDAARSSGFTCYRALYDTFHHFLGPDTEKDIGSLYDVARTGLIHVSGVESEIAKEKYRDEHRVLPSQADRTFSREQIERHVALGYRGDISLEPFSPSVQSMPRKELAAAVKRSVEYLRS